jgi:hypothetical protein
MNKYQRKELERANDLLEEAKEIISRVKDEEQDKYDNLPEGLQNTNANKKLEENADELDDIETNLLDVIRDLLSVTQ